MQATPPRVSGSLPLIGHGLEFIRDTTGLLFRAQKECGEVAAFSAFGKSLVALFGPEAHEAVFRATDKDLNPAEAYKIMTPIFGKGVVYDATPEVMGQQIRMFMPALKEQAIREYVTAIVEECERAMADWGDSGTLDLVSFCRVLTNFTSSRCLLGREFRDDMSEEFAKVYKDLERGVTALAYISEKLPIKAFRDRDKARVKMVAMITKIVAKRRASASEAVRTDFLQTLMEASYNDGTPLNEDEITGMLLAAMFAGHHMSSVTTSWSIIELLKHPEAMQRTLAEIDGIFAGGEMTRKSLRDLVFTENTVRETLRLHPPIFSLVRVVQRDFTYKNFFFKKGTWLMVSPLVAHRMPDAFVDPDRFDPDRFAPGRVEEHHPFAYIAFGAGRHKCIGNGFALVQIKVILAMILSRYELAQSGDVAETDFHGLVIGPKEPYRVMYKRRVDGARRGEADVSQVASAMTAEGGAVMTAVDAIGSGAMASGATAAGCPMSQPVQTRQGCPMHHADELATPFQIHIDLDLCQGHGACALDAPELFRIDPETGKAEVAAGSFGVEHAGKARAAVRACPGGAIRVE